MVDSALSQLSLDCHGLQQLEGVAEKIILFNQGHNVWLFEGEMGAGKTTLIKTICNKMDVVDLVNSPTFSIVNEYRDIGNNIYYHFDFYRIKDDNEALDIGVEEYLDSGDYCFIEWPSKISNLLPKHYVKVDIKMTDQDDRSIEVTRYD